MEALLLLPLGGRRAFPLFGQEAAHQVWAQTLMALEQATTISRSPMAMAVKPPRT